MFLFHIWIPVLTPGPELLAVVAVHNYTWGSVWITGQHWWLKLADGQKHIFMNPKHLTIWKQCFSYILVIFAKHNKSFICTFHTTVCWFTQLQPEVTQSTHEKSEGHSCSKSPYVAILMIDSQLKPESSTHLHKWPLLHQGKVSQGHPGIAIFYNPDNCHEPNVPLLLS